MTQSGLRLREQHVPVLDRVLAQHGGADRHRNSLRVDAHVAGSEDVAHRIGPVLGCHDEVGHEAQEALDIRRLSGAVVVTPGVVGHMYPGRRERLLHPRRPYFSRNGVGGSVVHEHVHDVGQREGMVDQERMTDMRREKFSDD